MTKNAEEEIREACHIMAEHIMRTRPGRHSYEWLREQMLEILLEPTNIEGLAYDYAQEYPYAEVQNPYLVEVLKAYDGDSE